MAPSGGAWSNQCKSEVCGAQVSLVAWPAVVFGYGAGKTRGIARRSTDQSSPATYDVHGIIVSAS